MPQTKGQRLLLLGTIVAYCLIGVEIVVMISPFALYFYSVYAPILKFLSASPLTSWTTEFFLPHMVFLRDPLIIGISYLQILLVVGLILFFTAAIPLYWGRFTGKGVVTFSFYSRIRHPQYLFLAISGLGLLLYWPRFIILILYITMLYVYYLLARNEEWRMRNEAPQMYASYMERIPMFLPGEPGGKIFAALFGWLHPRWLALMVSYLVVMMCALLLAIGLRNYAVSRLPEVTTPDGLTLVPVFERPTDEVLDLYQRVSAAPKVQEALKQNPEINLAYLMPGDFFLPALVTDEARHYSDEVARSFPEVLEWHQHKFGGGIGKFFRIFSAFIGALGTSTTDYDVERFIFVAVSTQDGKAVPPGKLFAMGLRRTPVLMVDYDRFAEQVVLVVPTSGTNKWGAIPMPTF
jgi:protein-S-isoprenylcysteine O-methyltransferase Ste14